MLVLFRILFKFFVSMLFNSNASSKLFPIIRIIFGISYSYMPNSKSIFSCFSLEKYKISIDTKERIFFYTI